MRWLLGRLPRESYCSSFRWEGRQCMSCWLQSYACAEQCVLKIRELAPVPRLSLTRCHAAGVQRQHYDL